MMGLIGVMSFEPTCLISLGFDACGVVIPTLGADIKPLLRKCCWLKPLHTCGARSASPAISYADGVVITASVMLLVVK